MTDEPYIPFSQRTGLAPIPPQLKPGEASQELRRYLYYALHKEIDRVARHGVDRAYFDEKWLPVALDFQVRIVGRPPDEFRNSSFEFDQALKRICFQTKIGALFDVVEFFARHSHCGAQLRRDLAQAFVDARAAYRLVDNKVCETGTGEQADAFIKAVDEADAAGAGGARKHLVDAATKLKDGDWAGSVRDSIHAVESVAKRLAPEATTLGPALSEIEKRGHLHGGLKAAFGALYGYTSDEAGIRHALSDEEAKVDEADALFMLGACASFVSYLLARGAAAPPAAPPA